MLFNRTRTHLQPLDSQHQNIDRATERYPAAFSPASSTEVNAPRLPPPDELLGMELAFREEPLSEDALIRKFGPSILLFLFFGPVATMFSLMIGRIIPLAAALVIATLAGLIAAATLFVFQRNRNFRLIVGLIVFPPIYVMVMGIITGFIGSRPWSVILLAAVIAFLLFFADGHLRPLQFYKDWILTHPRLKARTRHRTSAELSWLRPSVLFCLGVFLSLTVGYAYWPSMFLMAVFAALALFSLFFLSWDWKIMARMLVHYLGYTGRSTGAAGVWMPRRSATKRRAYLVSVALLFYAAMTIGTGFYSLADETFINRRAEEIAAAEKISFRTAKQRALIENAKAAVESVQNAPVSHLWQATWNQHTDPYQIFRETTASSPTNAAPQGNDFFRKLRGDLAQLWGLAGLLSRKTIIAIIISNAWLLLLFYFGVDRADSVRTQIEGGEKRDFRYRLSQLRRYLRSFFGGKQQTLHTTFIPGYLDNDGRTEWQWYVDRVRVSEHAAIDPFGNTVREAEHLFLGVEPSLQIPVLLDRKIVSEHCYIVGQTGSGKTTLGIMPLLIQLIRGHNSASPDRYRKILSRLLSAFVTHARKVQMNMGDSEAPAEAMNDMLAYIFEQSFIPQQKEDAFEIETIRHLQEELAARVKRSVERRESAETALRDLIAYAKEKRVSLSHELPDMPFRDDVDHSKFISPPVPMVVIDLKGDPALFNTVKAEAEARGQDFLFFTPEKGKVSFRFNPFIGFRSEARTFIQLCQLFLDSLSLNHGEGYGRSYYSRRNRQALFLALTHPSKPQTFGELLDVMIEMFKSTEHRDAYEALTTIHALSQYEALITTAEQEANAPETVINMARVIERNQVVYFWLPSAIESISAKEIGKLALFALLTAAIDRQLTNPQAETKQVYLVVDEFQRLAGENFKIILEQARSFGLSAILANQTLADLRTKDSDLRSTVLTNTRMRLFFTMNDPMEMKTISTLSGEEIRLLKSWTSTDDFGQYIRRDTQSETVIEGFKPRLTVNDIASISDHPLEMIAHITRGSGYTQFGGLPIRVRTAWPMPKEEYEKRARTPWPTREQFGMDEVIENLKSPKEIDQEALREVSERQQATLTKVLGEIEANA